MRTGRETAGRAGLSLSFSSSPCTSMLRRHHQGVAAWLWAACAFVVAAAGGVAAEAPAESTADRLALRPVAVEALGFALMGPGVTQGEAHAAALADARRNALVQAHAALEAETVVARMRVAAELVRVSSAGYVQGLKSIFVMK